MFSQIKKAMLFFMLVMGIKLSAEASTSLENQSTGYVRPVIQVDGVVSPEIVALLKLTKVATPDLRLASVVEVTQSGWLRPAGQERWDVAPRFEDKRAQIMAHLTTLQATQTINPSKKYYDYCVVNGAAVSRIRARLADLKTVWLSGVRFDKLVFQTSNRPLSVAAGETAENLLNTHDPLLPARPDWRAPADLPTTEAQAFAFLFDQADMPQELREVVRIEVNAPMKANEKGELTVRPGRADTIKLFLELLDGLARNEGGDCLIISSNPHIWYEDAVARHYMPEQFTIETVGFAVDTDKALVAVYLDMLARWLYEENQIQTNAH